MKLCACGGGGGPAACREEEDAPQLFVGSVRCAVHNRPDEDLIVVLWSLLNARNRTFPVVK